MAGAHPELDLRLPLPLGVPAVHLGRANLELQSRGDPIGGLQGVVLGVLSVGMKVDEPRGHDEAPRIDRLLPLEAALRDGHDLSP